MPIWKQGSHHVLQQWAKTYGDVFGYYEGSTPVVVISSIEAIENVCIKQAKVFNGRLASSLQPDSDKEPNHALINMMIAKGERWQKPRSTSVKFFSASNVKNLFPIIDKRRETLVKLLENSKGKPIVVDELFERFAMDFLGEAALDIDLNLLEGNQVESLPENTIYMNARRMMKTFLADVPLAFKILTTIPEIVPLTTVSKDFFYFFFYF